MTLPKAVRVHLARAAALERWSREDPREAMRQVRAKALETLAKQVDPDGVLSETERARRVEAARKAQIERMRAGQVRALAEKKERKEKAHVS